MLVSIIVPFYNVELYLRRCLNSIVNQSYRDLEIILVNDCSPDNSIAIAKEYADQDKRITILTHENSLHVGGARNSGMAIAKGEYIWFIDSDDEIATPYAVEHLVAVAQRDHSDVILFRAQSKLEDHTKFYLHGDYRYDRESIFDEQHLFYPVFLDVILHDQREYAGFSPAVWMKFFKSSFLKEYHFTFLEHTLHQDIATLMLLPLAKKLTQLPYIFYYYYQREGSSINSKAPEAYIEHFERVANQLWQMYDDYWLPLEIPASVIGFLLMNHVGYNTRRIKNRVTLEEYQQWLVELYGFFQRQLTPRVTFSQLQSWSSVVAFQSQWQILFEHLCRAVSESEKLALLSDIFDPGVTKDSGATEDSGTKGAGKMTQFLKMFVPYGLIRWVETYKHEGK